jgi:hypothetical protein
VTRRKRLAVGTGPDRSRLHALFAVLELHLWEGGHLLDELRGAEAAVQDGHVVRVDHVLEMLQPVAGCDADAATADA